MCEQCASCVIWNMILMWVIDNEMWLNDNGDISWITNEYKGHSMNYWLLIDMK